MTVTASPAHSKETLPQQSDIRGRNWATKEEIREVVAYDCEQRNVRLYPYLFENVWAVYNALRKRAAIGGDGTVSKRQLARDLYPDVGEDYDAYRRKQVSITRWLALLERQGLIGKEELLAGSGKKLGLRVELRAMSEVTALTSRRSSAGRAPFTAGSERIRLRKRKLAPKEACEARVRPWCPRAGRGAPRRFEEPEPLFSPGRVESSGGEGGTTPTGSPPSPKETLAVRARGAPAGSSIDTIERQGSAEAVAALERRLTAALGAEAFATLARAEEAFVAALGSPPAGRLGHLPTIRELLWVLARLDRYASFGRGKHGAGLEVLEGRLEGMGWEARYYGVARPKHLGYFLPALRAEAKRWKHQQAPKIKAERRARGAGRARRRSPIDYRRPS